MRASLRRYEEFAERRRVPSGTRYLPPADVIGALTRIFGEPVLERIEVVFRPRYVRAHLFCIGGRVGSVTRPGRIYTNIAEEWFFALDRHVLHEYYHVVQQWGREGMTRYGYLRDHRTKEAEAHAFAAANVERYRELRRELGAAP